MIIIHSHQIGAKNGTRIYCSKECQAKAYSRKYLRENNPNFRGRTVDTDGYSINIRGKTRTIHVWVVYEHFNISKHPDGYNVHHRDCNKQNNEKINLALLTFSDHRWLHKQFGSATLWAYCNGKISKNDIVSWSNDRERALSLLDVNITNQDINKLIIND